MGNLNLLMTISYLRHEGTAGLLKILCAFLISLCSSPLCPWYSMCRTLGAHAHLSRTHFFETVSICIPNHNVTIRNKHSKTNCVNFFLLLQFDVVQKTTTNTTNMNEDSCRQRQICPQLFFCILLYCNYIYIYIKYKHILGTREIFWDSTPLSFTQRLGFAPWTLARFTSGKVQMILCVSRPARFQLSELAVSTVLQCTQRINILLEPKFTDYSGYM